MSDLRATLEALEESASYVVGSWDLLPEGYNHLAEFYDAMGQIRGDIKQARAALAAPALDVERLGAAMEAACDSLSVSSLCPADAPVLAAAYDADKGAGE